MLTGYSLLGYARAWDRTEEGMIARTWRGRVCRQDREAYARDSASFAARHSMRALSWR